MLLVLHFLQIIIKKNQKKRIKKQICKHKLYIKTKKISIKLLYSTSMVFNIMRYL